MDTLRIKPLNSKRLEHLKAQMSDEGIEAAILVKPENVFYFSHFNPVINSYPVFMLIPAQGEPCLLVHCLRYMHAQEESCISNIRCYGKWGDTPSLAPELADAIQHILGEPLYTAGFELENIPAALCTQLCEKLRIRESFSLSGMISMMKTVKDPYEIDCIRRSARLVEVFGMIASDLDPRHRQGNISRRGNIMPPLARGNRIVLAPSMLITIEPGLMDKSWGGVRLVV